MFFEVTKDFLEKSGYTTAGLPSHYDNIYLDLLFNGQWFLVVVIDKVQCIYEYKNNSWAFLDEGSTF